MATACAAPQSAYAASGIAVEVSCGENTLPRLHVRKPNRQAAVNKPQMAGKHGHQPITKVLREAIEDAAAELWAKQDEREYSRVIARRLGVSEHLVDEVLTGLMLEHRSAAAAYRVGFRNAEDLAAEARKDAWEDVA